MAKGSSSSSTLSVRESSSHAALEPVPDEGGSAASPSPSSSNAELLSVSFNQDYVCFACGTASGFRIYDCDPFRETFRRDFGKGVGMVEMLFRCNILALVGGGASPRYPPNKVMIWDDHQSRCIGELSFRSNVRAVRLRRDRIVVVLEHKIYVYNFADLKLLHQIDTIANPKGLCSLSPSSNAIVLACLGLHRGHVRVEHYGIKRTKFIPAHESDVAAFALTLDGRLLATASKKGTLIRVFNSLDGTRLQEVRRGADKAEIYSIAFSSNDQWLAVSSDRGTVHVFGLRTPASAEEPVSVVSSSSTGQEGYNLVLVDNGSNIPVATSSPLAFSGVNPGSTLSFMKGVLPRYFSSEWSFAQFRLPEDVQTLVAFSHRKNTVVIVGMNGSYYKCTFDPDNGGPMKKLEDTTILKPDSASEAV